MGASPMLCSCVTFALVAMCRGCEVALDADRREQFDATQHMTVHDVAFFVRGGVRHARVRMRKRKDLRVLRGKQALVVIAGGGWHFDAAQDLHEWLLVRRALGLGDDGPLFCHSEGRMIAVAELRALKLASMVTQLQVCLFCVCVCARASVWRGVCVCARAWVRVPAGGGTLYPRI